MSLLLTKTCEYALLVTIQEGKVDKEDIQRNKILIFYCSKDDTLKATITRLKLKQNLT